MHVWNLWGSVPPTRLRTTGLDTLQSHRDREKLKWWYKLVTLPEDRYPKQLFNQEWNIIYCKIRMSSGTPNAVMPRRFFM